MSDIENDLAKLQEEWSKAEEGGTQFPDGMFTFEITDTNLGKSQASGRLQLGLKLTCVVGENAGKVVWNYQGLDNATSMTWFKRNMTRLEVAPPENLTELVDWHAAALRGITFLAQVKNKDGFTNVYPQKRVEVDGTGGAAKATDGLGM